MSDWHNSDKKNQGFGQSFGDDARFFGNENLVDDRDGVDSPVTQTSYGREIPALIEKL